ncbi:NAD(P)H-dependent oxidoreductase [Pseudoalteromonas obscura]|uniref:NAD(P)H-dependent oxidoreductase n=1 Tax=Pseudoalteromonas obscura TaxID=3048491 RepID=A0ABT7EG68_9GAMM|nr:NAD(P)H-dependent oxidoreductase [Pseudoalteromonas sp. P94(2023)]MDK2594064.1 NAD(P)H-dependent oxidoreductase [Pseudoalteromonas sp. P94(2023)]
MTKKILVLNGNPKSNSFGQHLADIYSCEAREYFEVRRFNLSEMPFNASLQYGYNTPQILEPILVEFQKAVLWAEHIVIISPIWWGGLPAKLKGLFDRAFLPDFSFKYEKDNPVPVQLLTGKTSRLILTMDMPAQYMEEQAAPVITQLDTYTLQFCGIQKAQINLFGSLVLATPDDKQKWEGTMKSLGRKGL